MRRSAAKEDETRVDFPTAGISATTALRFKLDPHNRNIFPICREFTAH
jgi:hypothetical protein